VRWSAARLGDVCRIVSGSTPRTGVEEFWNGSIPWATPKDLSGLGAIFIQQTAQAITESGYRSCSTQLLPANSVLLSSRAPIGYAAINSVPMCTNQGFKSLVPNAERLDSLYLCFWLRAHHDYLQSLGNGATFKEISKATVERIVIPLPPLPEQKRIAAILDKADALRRKRREAIAKLDTLLQSVFLQMFGDPASNPKRWPVLRLEQVMRFRTGKLDANAAVPDGEYPFFTCSRENYRIDKYAFDCEALLLSGNNASADYSVKYYNGKFNAYQRTYVITLADSSHSYFYMRMALERKLNDMKRLSKGTNTKYLTLEILNSLPMQVPCAELQQAFRETTRSAGFQHAKMAAHLQGLERLFTVLQSHLFKADAMDGRPVGDDQLCLTLPF
jgi:type I restriction enzyme S subunit